VQTTRSLLRLDPEADHVDDDIADLWENFELVDWERKRLRLSEDNLHALPHAGGCQDLEEKYEEEDDDDEEEEEYEYLVQL
jgi:hypothetical protein